jgi:hypothetical protein
MRMNLFDKRRSDGPSKNGSGSNEPVTHGDREGFCILQAHFELPADSAFLDPKSKRALTICNLFVNHRLPVSEIAQLLEEDLAQVVQVLVQAKIVRDRRTKTLTLPLEVERRKAQPETGA